MKRNKPVKRYLRKRVLLRRFHQRWLAARAEYLEMARKIVITHLTKP